VSTIYAKGEINIAVGKHFREKNKLYFRGQIKNNLKEYSNVL
jgi:hypothetical protein